MRRGGRTHERGEMDRFHDEHHWEVQAACRSISCRIIGAGFRCGGQDGEDGMGWSRECGNEDHEGKRRGKGMLAGTSGDLGKGRHTNGQGGRHGKARGASTCLTFMPGITAQSVANQRSGLTGTRSAVISATHVRMPERAISSTDEQTPFRGRQQTDNHRRAYGMDSVVIHHHG
jgi:hypothetical protein